MVACSNFTPGRWKPDQCCECFEDKDKHLTSQTTVSERQSVDASTELNMQNSSSDKDSVEKKIECWYGMNCRRKNPSHFEQYSHPPGFKMQGTDIDPLTRIESQTTQNQEISQMHLELVEKRFLESIADLKVQNTALQQEIEKLRKDKVKMAMYHQHLEKDLANEVNDRERREIEKQRILAIPRATPSYWGTNAFVEQYREIDIRQDSPEFNVINDLLNSTVGTHNNKYGTIYGKDPTEFIITKLTRIHNDKLWHEYCFKKERIVNKANNCLEDCASSKYLRRHPLFTPLLDATANEYWLFHGCDSEKALPYLIDTGYDPRISTLDGMFGGGFYLAENSSKSNQYIPCPACGKNSIFSGSGCSCKNQEKLIFSIILYRTVLGDVHVAKKYDKKKYCGDDKKRVRRPPSKENSKDLYDSVMGESIEHGGDLLNYREFILYEPGQAYPEYIIQFKRSAKNARAPSDVKRILDKCHHFLRNTFKLRPE